LLKPRSERPISSVYVKLQGSENTSILINELVGISFVWRDKWGSRSLGAPVRTTCATSLWLFPLENAIKRVLAQGKVATGESNDNPAIVYVPKY